MLRFLGLGGAEGARGMTYFSDDVGSRQRGPQRKREAEVEVLAASDPDRHARRVNGLDSVGCCPCSALSQGEG